MVTALERLDAVRLKIKVEDPFKLFDPVTVFDGVKENMVAVLPVFLKVRKRRLGLRSCLK